MGKHGQHQNDDEDRSKPGGNEKSKGHNNPSQSQTITTGTYKKPETYQKQAAERRANNRAPQADRNEWSEDIREAPSIENSPRARDSDITGGRSGSDSNASKSSQGH